jgi:hypothetical protein
LKKNLVCTNSPNRVKMKAKLMFAALALSVVSLCSFTISATKGKTMQENLASFNLKESDKALHLGMEGQFKSGNTVLITVVLFALAWNLGPKLHLAPSQEQNQKIQLAELDAK